MLAKLGRRAWTCRHRAFCAPTKLRRRPIVHLDSPGRREQAALHSRPFATLGVARRNAPNGEDRPRRGATTARLSVFVSRGRRVRRARGRAGAQSGATQSVPHGRQGGEAGGYGGGADFDEGGGPGSDEGCYFFWAVVYEHEGKNQSCGLSRRGGGRTRGNGVLLEKRTLGAMEVPAKVGIDTRDAGKD